MADHRIVCCDFQAAVTPTRHQHITGVGTGSDPAKATEKWAVVKVRAAMTTDRFYTVSPSTSGVAMVEAYTCGCGYETIRSSPDSVTDNNLDNLRTCSWAS
jgi:Protein of unknown function (DUF3892)